MGCAQKLIRAKLREIDKKKTERISKKIAFSFHNQIREKSL